MSLPVRSDGQRIGQCQGQAVTLDLRLFGFPLQQTLDEAC
jgi:hypothetical protein